MALPIACDVGAEMSFGAYLSGTVTTDGTLGALAEEDVASWSLAISGGFFSSAISSTSPAPLLPAIFLSEMFAPRPRSTACSSSSRTSGTR